MKRLIFGVLAMCLCLLTACGGSNRIEDKYTFGTAYVQFGGTTLALELPFDLRAPQNDAELKYAKERQLTRFGANDHLLVMVEADEAATKPLAAKLEETRALYRSPALREAQCKEAATEVAGVPATRFDVAYRQSLRNGKEVALTGTAYVWEKDGVIWKVLYQYPTQDAEGQALADRARGKLTFR